MEDLLRALIEKRIGKIKDTVKLYGGSERSFERYIGRKSTLIVLTDYDSRRLDNYVITGRYLSAIGHIGPDIYEHLWEMNKILLEDLGDISLLDKYRQGDSRVYDEVLELLILLQSAGSRRELPVVISKNPFDTGRLEGEFNQFKQHFLIEYLRGSASHLSGLIADAERAFRHLAAEIHQQPKVFMHRDFQSMNIMFHEQKPKVIDFQSAAVGPYTYDLVSLLEDPYTALSTDKKREFKLKYVERMHDLDFLAIDRSRFWVDYENSAISRLMQAVGAFARLTIAGKTHFQQYIEPALRIIISHLSQENSIYELCAQSLIIVERVSNKE